MLNKVDLVDKWTFKVCCLSSSHIFSILAPGHYAVALYQSKSCKLVTFNDFTYPYLIKFYWCHHIGSRKVLNDWLHVCV